MTELVGTIESLNRERERTAAAVAASATPSRDSLSKQQGTAVPPKKLPKMNDSGIPNNRMSYNENSKLQKDSSPQPESVELLLLW